MALKSIVDINVPFNGYYYNEIITGTPPPLPVISFPLARLYSGVRWALLTAERIVISMAAKLNNHRRELN